MTEKIEIALLEEDSKQEVCWERMYQVVRPPTRGWVWRSGIWIGQEEDVAEDIVHDAVERLYKHMQRAEMGGVSPVEHPERMIIVIAHRCFLDRWRKDRRLVRFDQDNRLSLEYVVQATAVNPAEVALDIVFQGWLYVKIADIVSKRIPDKQRMALLRDLAQRMHFGHTPTSLQQAFADKGMDLERYRDWKSADKREQSQHASNLSLSYKRIEEWSNEALPLSLKS